MANHEFHPGKANGKKNKFHRRCRPLTNPRVLRLHGLCSRKPSKYNPAKEDEKHETQALEFAAEQIT